MAGIMSIAARNVFRNKRRTLLTAITMTVGIGFFIWMDSYLAGLDSGSVRSLAEYSESAVRVCTAAYAQRRLSSPLADGIGNPQEALTAIASLPGIAGAAPRTPFVAQLSCPSGDLAVQAAAIDPQLDPLVFKLKEHVRGQWLSSAPGPGADPEIIMGSALAQELGLWAGDHVTVYAKARYDTNRAQDFKLVGTFDTPDPNLNSGAAYVSYAQADAFLDLGGLVTEIRVAVKDSGGIKAFLASTDVARNRIESALGAKGGLALEATSLNDLSAEFLALSATKRKSGYMLIAILLFISAVGIVNTILMSVYARIREIGVLGAFGMRRREITDLFLAEGLIIGFIGSAAGTALGVLLDLQAVLQGMPLDKLAGKINTAGIPIWGTLKGEWNPKTLVFGFAFGMVVALVSSWIPARRAGKMRITRALRAN